MRVMQFNVFTPVLVSTDRFVLVVVARWRSVKYRDKATPPFWIDSVQQRKM